MPEIPASKRAQCASCGKDVWRGATSATTQRCQPCRRDVHGRYRYRKGCRCDECRTAHRDDMRKFTAARRDAGRPWQPPRVIVERTCIHCGDVESVRADNGSESCRRCSNLLKLGLDPTADFADLDRFRISRAERLAIYERDGWACQICSEPLEPDAEPSSTWYPTLDHINPRSRGGSDDHSNLRAAHHWCNSVRGAGQRFTDEELRNLLSA